MDRTGMALPPLLAATRVLAKNIEDLKAAKIADSFADLPVETQNLVDTGLSSFIPYAVLMAFRAEIAIKAALDGLGTPTGGHQLKILFLKLPIDRQDNIKTILNDADFDNNLSNTSNAFIDWRYFFENAQNHAFDTRFLHHFTDAIEKEMATEIAASAAG